MNGKTNTMRRRLSVVALAASIAVVAVPAATAGGKYDAGLVPSKLGSPDPRGAAQENQTFSPSVIDRWVGSPDPRDAITTSLSRNEGVSSEIFRDASQEHAASGFLGQTTNVQKIVRDSAQEHGAAGFGNTTLADRDLHLGSAALAPNYSHLPAEDRP
jgi:hypothetical protein